MKLSFEGGATYFSNNAGDTTNRLADFFALTINPRLILYQAPNSAFCIEAPVSFRSKVNEEVNSRLGVHLPLLITYSIGSGSGGQPETTRQKKMGVTAGFGWGYFFQRNRSPKNATIVYNETLETAGPAVQAGIRIPLKKQLILFERNNPVNMLFVVKGNYLFNSQYKDRSIASLAFLLGFYF